MGEWDEGSSMGISSGGRACRHPGRRRESAQSLGPNRPRVYQFQSFLYGSCLVARGGRETAVTMAPCNTYASGWIDQWWYFNGLSAQNAFSRMCLTARSFQNAIVTDCNTTYLDQLWYGLYPDR